jgi:EAL domain-containing protein (putative c-di-GMP-specific phosphodiesterase class I)
LYGQLRQHTAVLQDRLDLQLAQEEVGRTRYDRQRQRIEGALGPDQLSIVYQPFVSLDSMEIVGAEALSRFAGSPDRPPNEWFDEASQVGLLAPLELSAVALALSRLDELPAGSFMSVNVSPATAVSAQFVEILDALPADRILLELTEHTQVADYGVLSERLAGFLSRGGRVAVDDAGVGYAGLHHILSLRPDVIKLDIALTKGIDTDPARRSLASALVRFGSEIDATIIAEGIETRGELEVLRELGVDWGQGFFLARPADLPLHIDVDAGYSSVTSSSPSA